MASSNSKDRIPLSLAAEPLAWMRQRSGRSGPFAGDSHAVQLTCQRLQDEQGFIQNECRRRGVAYQREAFWNTYRDLIAEWSPNRRGRPSHALAERGRVWALLDEEQQKWMDAECRDGPFESPSHIIETGLRHLQRLEPTERLVSGLGFPFDAQVTWKSYQAEAKALKARPRKP